MDVLVGSLAGLCLGAFLGWKFHKSASFTPFRDLQVRAAAATARYIFVLRRELENALCDHDPDSLLALYDRAIVEQTDLKGDPQYRRVALANILTDHPDLNDFDIVARHRREFVSYSDAFADLSQGEIEERWLMLTRLHTILHLDNPSWAGEGLHLDAARRRMASYVQRIKDTQFCERMRRALRLFDAHRRNAESAGPLETPELHVDYGPTYGFDLQYAVHFKDTDEHGLWVLFDDRPLRIYRSDAGYGTRNYVNPFGRENRRYLSPSLVDPAIVG